MAGKGINVWKGENKKKMRNKSFLTWRRIKRMREEKKQIILSALTGIEQVR
jgi:hypothetical protein